MNRLLPWLLCVTGALLMLVSGAVAYLLSLPITDPSNEEIAIHLGHWHTVYLVATLGCALFLVGCGWFVRSRSSSVRRSAVAHDAAA